MPTGLPVSVFPLNAELTEREKNVDGVHCFSGRNKLIDAASPSLIFGIGRSNIFLALTKNKLGSIIRDLFIKPSFYECQPDLRTLQFTVQDNVCTLNLSIKEKIKADKKSKTEIFSSKVEYVVDRSFKILAEKNLE